MINSSQNMRVSQAMKSESNDETILFSPQGRAVALKNPSLVLFLASVSFNLEVFLGTIFFEASAHTQIYQKLIQVLVLLTTLTQALTKEYFLRRNSKLSSIPLNFAIMKFGKFINTFCFTSLYVSQVKIIEKAIAEKTLKEGGIHLVTAVTVLFLICSWLNKAEIKSIIAATVFLLLEACIWFLLVLFYNERNIHEPLQADSQGFYFHLTAFISLMAGLLAICFQYKSHDLEESRESFYKEVLSNMDMGIVCLNKKNELIFRNSLALNYFCAARPRNIVRSLRPFDYDSVLEDGEKCDYASFKQQIMTQNITIVKSLEETENAFLHPNQLKLEDVLCSDDTMGSGTRYFFFEARKSITEATRRLSSNDEDKTLWQDEFIEKDNPKLFELKIKRIARSELFESFKIISVFEISQSSLFLQSQDNRRMKNNLLTAVSHELNTPLNGSITLLDCALADEDVPDSFKEKYGKQTRASMQNLKYLINDIIDFLKIETKQISLDIEDFDPRVLISEISEMIRPKCEYRQLEFQLSGSLVEPKKPKPLTFRSDPLKLRRILFNLLSNCAKYTFSGMVALKVDVAPNNTRLDFEISDSRFAPGSDLIHNDKHELGVFVSKELAKLLNPKGKTGGLSIEVLESQGIKYSFSLRKFSPLGESLMFPSKFHFLSSQKNMENCSFGSENLPIFDEGLEAQPNAVYRLAPHRDFFFMSQPINHPHIPQTADKGAPTILIVDDDSFNIVSLELILRKLGYTCIKAFNGQQAIEKVRDFYKGGQGQSLSAIFMDLMMPVMGGLRSSQVIKKIMKKGEVPFCHIFGCSANDSKEDIMNCKYSGMSAFLSKPLTIEKVQTTLRKFNIYSKAD